MIHDSKILEKIIDIIDLAHENALLVEVIVTAMENALEKEIPYNQGAMESKILTLLEDSAFIEWDLSPKDLKS